jgi:hypothetical protein
LKIACAALLVLLVFPASSFALDIEYYTYNAFEPLKQSLEKISLIFSDQRYGEIAESVAIVGLFLAAAVGAFNMIRTGHMGSLFMYFIPYLLGVAIFIPLVFNNKGNVYLYDAVTNQTSTIADVPDAITLPMYILNLIERYTVDIIDTTLAPNSPARYGVSAGGIYSALIYQSLINPLAIYGDTNKPDSYLSYTIQRYIEDCLFFANQTGDVSINEVKQESLDFMDQLEQSVNPANYTVVQKDAPGWRNEDHAASCTVAWFGGLTDAGGNWAGLKNYLMDSTKFDGMLRQVCSSIGYDVTNPGEILACRSMMDGLVDYTHGGTISMAWYEFLRQVNLAHKINEALVSYAPGTTTIWLANLENMSTMTGIAIVANEWMPVVRGVVTGVTFFLTPFLILFFLTPAFPRVLITVLGFFIWLTLWGIMDVGMHTYAIDYAYNVYHLARANMSLAYDQIMLMPNAAIKGMAISGIVRSSSMMFATLFTGLLIRNFGGTALAMLSSNISGHLKSSGASAGHAAMTPEGTSQKLASTEMSIPTIANAGRYDFGQRVEAKTYQQAGNIESGIQTSNFFGGPFSAAHKTGYARSTSTAKSVGHAVAAGGPSVAIKTGEIAGLSDKAYTEKAYPDKEEIANISARDKFHSQMQNPAEVLYRTDPGFFGSKDKAHEFFRRMQASYSAVGRHNAAYDLAMFRLSKQLGFWDGRPEDAEKAIEKARQFYGNMTKGDLKSVLKDSEQKKAFELITGKAADQISSSDLNKWGSILGNRFKDLMSKATDDMAGIFPHRHAAEAASFDWLSRNYGMNNFQSFLSFTTSADKMDKLTNSRAKFNVVRGIAKEHFRDNVDKASQAVADYKNFQIQGLINDLADNGYDPQKVSELKGAVQARTDAGLMRWSAVSGKEGIERTKFFGNANADAKSWMLLSVAAIQHNKPVSEISDQEYFGTMKANQGSYVSATSEGGVETYSLTDKGQTLYSTSVGVWNSGQLQDFISEMRANNPAAGQRLSGFHDGSDSNQNYAFMVMRDRSGNVVKYDIYQGGRSVSEVVSQKRDVSVEEMRDVPLQTDASTVWNKVQSMDSSFAKTLLSGTRAEQDTMARDVSNMLATNLFLSRHGVDTERFEANLGIGSGINWSGSEHLKNKSMVSIIGRALSISPNASLRLGASNSYREEIDKISKDLYDEITGHQELVNDNSWTIDQGAEQLSKNLKTTLREYVSKEDISDNTERGKDFLPFKDNR